MRHHVTTRSTVLTVDYCTAEFSYVSDSIIIYLAINWFLSCFQSHDDIENHARAVVGHEGIATSILKWKG